MFEVTNINPDMMSFFESLGAKTEMSNELQIIKGFTTPEDETFSLHNGVGLRYMNTSGIIELKGHDSLEFLHRISTNSIKDLKKEDVKQTIFTSEKGRIIGISTVLNFESYLLLVASLQNEPKILSWLNKYIVGDDVKIEDASHRFNIFEILGPQSESFLNFTIGDSVSSIRENSFNVVSNEGTLFFLAKIKDKNDKVKYWILADQENGKKTINYLLENKGPYDFNLVGEDAYHAYRIEMGIPLDPNELNDFYNPLESGINYLIDFKKGCYIGQEIIARIDTYEKVQKNLMGICFSEDIDLFEDYSLLDDQKNEIGKVTSIAYSPRIKKNIGMGYVKKGRAQNGNKVIAKNGVKEIEVTLHELPFKK
jgi:folate-binding protein YgfZ